ncbi:hypothetical protein [Teredinibacter franksiae]|uniref:hypothetical protein n=1 Tax=Teredinibacter franksiae TaxID=2761453 RepID=UPI001627E139|nr:hypothetical protein [Teredinibacter franksiae]
MKLNFPSVKRIQTLYPSINVSSNKFNASFPRAPSLDVPDLSNYSAESVTIKTGIF